MSKAPEVGMCLDCLWREGMRKGAEDKELEVKREVAQVL